MDYIVALYMMDNCHQCERAKDLLEELGIPYVSYNIKPYCDRGYPFFYILGTFYTYEEFNELMAKYMMNNIRKDNK